MQVIDLIGQKFSMLSVVSRSTNGKFGNSRWVCKCTCGRETIVDSHNLRRGTTRSCGCLDTHGRLISEDESSKNFLFFRYRKTCAKDRSLSFNIGREYFLNLVQQPCFYCGVLPKREIKSTRAVKGFLYNGLDRVDNARGYEIDNVVSCCKECNYAKRDMTQRDFIIWVKRCHDHSLRK